MALAKPSPEHEDEGGLRGTLSVIILTKDEEENLPHALGSLMALGAEIFVVDSGSTDRTLTIARAFGCHVVVRDHWISHAFQLNWAIDNLPISSPWLMRLDADEHLTPELAHELRAKLPNLGAEVAGLLVRRRVHFWGRWIRHGGLYPMWVLRFWRRGAARCEQRRMDEHMILTSGHVAPLNNDLIDENRKGLSFFVAKHNGYSDREVEDIMEGLMDGTAAALHGQAKRRRELKEQRYYRLPPLLRAVVYWLYKYIVLGGFLDGKAGFVYHFLQVLWYRILVDAKLFEQARSPSPK